MKYFKQIYDETEPYEITKEQAKSYLARCYNQDFVDGIVNDGKMFRLTTTTSRIWTKTDEGMVPAAGFLGVCE